MARGEPPTRTLIAWPADDEEAYMKLIDMAKDTHIVPLSMMTNGSREFAKWAPQIKAILYKGNLAQQPNITLVMCVRQKPFTFRTSP